MARLLFTAAFSVIACFTVFLRSQARAQSSGSPVSITPRSRPSPAAPTASSPEFHLRADSSLVLIPVHATSPLGTGITGLTLENFRLYEDGVEQKITTFSRESEPLSVGLVFDASGSMDRKIRESAAAAAAFFKTANRGDEFFLIEFGERPKLAVPFTADSGEIYSRISHSRGFGRTSLIDAIHLALTQMKTARHSRKAIVILSDGGDNHSRRSFREIQGTLLESDVQVYAMGLFDRDLSRKRPAEEEKGPDLLRKLAEPTGGRAYPVELDALASISEEIGNQLRNEYVLGYTPVNSSRDGKYRRVKVNLVPPPGAPELRVSYRRGYYAPVE